MSIYIEYLFTNLQNSQSHHLLQNRITTFDRISAADSLTAFSDYRRQGQPCPRATFCKFHKNRFTRIVSDDYETKCKRAYYYEKE